ncbi:molybdenum cofactor guanylyltransferase [Catenovulum sediminis]|uniref:molybdenum cofactor guanylyltransferase n=1 Tax=Catenovulum sediminis TaxID=1740262 RepID=UPI00117C7BCA|nr:molybdenum cofactor guanylyltransferase [Catenovulum sediminis]
MQSQQKTKNSHAFSALILAGGQSRRMGEDKAQLKLYGRNLLEYMQDKLERAGFYSVYVSGCKKGQIADRYPNYGPLAGLDALSALPDCPANVMVLPVDMPALSADLLTQLARQAVETKASLYFDSYMMPIALYGFDKMGAQISSVMQNKAAKARSLRAFIKLIQASARPLSSEHKKLLMNINTPEQWRAFLQTQDDLGRRF